MERHPKYGSPRNKEHTCGLPLGGAIDEWHYSRQSRRSSPAGIEASGTYKDGGARSVAVGHFHLLRTGRSLRYGSGSVYSYANADCAIDRRSSNLQAQGLGYESLPRIKISDRRCPRGPCNRAEPAPVLP